MSTPLSHTVRITVTYDVSDKPVIERQHSENEEHMKPDTCDIYLDQKDLGTPTLRFVMINGRYIADDGTPGPLRVERVYASQLQDGTAPDWLQELVDTAIKDNTPQ